MEVRKQEATYTLLDGVPLEVSHHGKPITLSREAAVTEPIPPGVDRPAPSQPPGREPYRRHVRDDAP